jgi:hypothetical protein
LRICDGRKSLQKSLQPSPSATVPTIADLRAALARDAPVGSRALCQRLGGVDRATLLRLVRQADDELLRLGKARRSAYALRRPVRGRSAPLPLYRIDAAGHGHLLGRLSLIEPSGSGIQWAAPCPWPLDQDMADGWFHGLPLYDMAPQGFLGRHCARRHATLLGVSEYLADWSDADIAHVLATFGQDQPGDLVLGEAALAGALTAQAVPSTRADYPALAERALAFGDAGSSAGGEHPKLATLIERAGAPVSVLRKKGVRALYAKGPDPNGANLSRLSI